MPISAIMPTRKRPQFARQAVECFQAQTWPDKELVIIDDADAPSFETPPRMENVQYHLSPRRLTIGAKRNLACSRASGDILMHWDDDDYSAPGRIEDQAARLIESGLPVTGYHSLIFETASGERWRFTREQGYALGSSLMYRRDYWRAHPFADKNVGEDNDLVYPAMRAREIATADARELLIARIHGANTSGAYRKLGQHEAWERVA